MSNKNPFEIRAEMLQLAKEYLDNQHAYTVSMTELLFKEGSATVSELQKAYTMYSPEELMKIAKDMYSFVSTKDTEK